MKSFHAAKSRRQSRPFPYVRVARMWKQGKTIKQIAYAIGMIDKHKKKDPCHSLRNFLYLMHKGYKDGSGQIVKLPHRVSRSTVKAAQRAGLRAWA